MQVLRAFRKAAHGATSIEYALIAGIVSLAVVVGATTIGNNLSAHYFTPISNNLT